MMLNLKNFGHFSFISVFLASSLISVARAELDSEISMNVKNSPMKSVLEIMAAKAGMELVMDSDPNISITLSQGNTTVKKLLEKMTAEQQIEYMVRGNQLIVSKRYLPNSANTGDSHLIPIKFAAVGDISGKIITIIGPEEKLLVDERTSSLIFVGSRRSFEKVMGLVQMLDLPPKQIMIEAQIVETSNSFLRNLGVALGDLSDIRMTNKSPVSGFSTNAGPTAPNIGMKAVLGRIGGRDLDFRLTAAESNGDAKVISRPKVMTLNNQQARINSGITYSIKTLSSITASTGTNTGSTAGTTGTGGIGGTTAGGVLTGGVTSVSAGLNLTITPSLVGNEQIRLVVDISNSQPDEGTAIDGIPGILTNSANTSVIVKNHETAVIAGLIKQSKSNSSSGVPILSNIPLIGWLFKSNSKSDRNNELVIFITPGVDENKIESVESPEEVAKRLPATAPDSPADDSFSPVEE
jgi:type IV pilus assembly protein PilQ